MAMPKFKLWSLPLWGGKKEREKTSKVNRSKESSERVRFPWKETRIAPAPACAGAGKNKKKWDKEMEEDLVIVEEDGVCLSGSESDWSIGWLEPHSPDFLSDDQTDDSFAVLVPCYRNYTPTITTTTTTTTTTTKRVSLGNNLTAQPFPEGKSRMEQWLSSLQNF